MLKKFIEMIEKAAELLDAQNKLIESGLKGICIHDNLQFSPAIDENITQLFFDFAKEKELEVVYKEYGYRNVNELVKINTVIYKGLKIFTYEREELE